MAFRILVTDDDEDDYFLLTNAFDSLGLNYHLDQFMNGEELIEYLSIRDNLLVLPDMIILDYNMPKMDGFETLVRIREVTAFNSIPVIIYSTSDDPKRMYLLFSKGADGYVQKSGSLKQIAEFVQAIDAYFKGKGKLPGYAPKATIVPHGG